MTGAAAARQTLRYEQIDELPARYRMTPISDAEMEAVMVCTAMRARSLGLCDAVCVVPPLLRKLQAKANLLTASPPTLRTAGRRQSCVVRARKQQQQQQEQ